MIRNTVKMLEFNKASDQEELELLKSLQPLFVMAPREISRKRLISIVKRYLPKRDIVFGVSKEAYVEGFDGQIQFKMLGGNLVKEISEKIFKAGLSKKFIPLVYSQKDIDAVIEYLRPAKIVVVRGSYQRVFHLNPASEVITKLKIPYSLISPFIDEAEAKQYLDKFNAEYKVPDIDIKLKVSELEVFNLVDLASKRSFDYSFQTGAALARASNEGYQVIDYAFNEVVPYQTYALLVGNAREDNKLQLNDISHYDTIHAEMNLLVKAMQSGINFDGKSLFINLMPCPSCARTLAKTGLKEIIYKGSHSGDYAEKLFKQSNITTRKVS